MAANLRFFMNSLIILISGSQPIFLFSFWSFFCRLKTGFLEKAKSKLNQLMLWSSHIHPHAVVGWRTIVAPPHGPRLLQCRRTAVFSLMIPPRLDFLSATALNKRTFFVDYLSNRWFFFIWWIVYPRPTFVGCEACQFVSSILYVYFSLLSIQHRVLVFLLCSCQLQQCVHHKPRNRSNRTDCWRFGSSSVPMSETNKTEPIKIHTVRFRFLKNFS